MKSRQMKVTTVYVSKGLTRKKAEAAARRKLRKAGRLPDYRGLTYNPKTGRVRIV